jgi:cellulose synthase/poly-beta-1,6-N-acetylglucosamine synthase-like glycosyltransferase/peptidoglycan/xylan/chitin deacetylase (PgdA/CDA1 family)/peptidoglycan/LPS O-acetylase OafA/YrhL
VAVALVLGFAAILGVAGIGSARASNDAGAHPPVGTDTVPQSVREGGPWVDAIHNPVTSRNLPSKTIALTFDDGPDPTWTPEVVAVLRKHHVPGTFVVVGSNVSRYPDLVRAIRDSGSELGVHTFSHPDLVDVSAWRMQRELDETQLAIAGSAGVTTYLLRPPYSSTAEAVDDLGYRTVLAAGALGYVTVFTTQDSEDWQRPGVNAIINNATPRPDDPNGAVVLMHDAGGNRTETVTALDQYIPEMQARGYRFTTVTAGLGMPTADTPASPSNREAGDVLLGVVAFAIGFVSALRWILLVVGVLVAVRMVLMVAVARRSARRRRSPGWRWGAPVNRPVSVIVPAYNESANIEATVRSIIANDYPLEVLVVDDGSADGTAAIVESLGLPRVRVLRQVNAGKSAALNTGIRTAQHDLIIMIDGDTIFEPETVWHLVQPFADPSIGAVAGNVKIANRDDLIGRLQHIEYVIGFNIDRRVQDVLGSIATIPGAAGAFRREALLRIGGLSSDTLAEDTDLTIALGRAGWRVVFEDRARAWTEAPQTVTQLWRQRFRWSYGTMQAIWKHRRAVREAGMAGKLGRRGLMHVAAFHIVLPLTAPLIDVFLVYGLLFEDAGTAVVLWVAMLLVQLAGALFAFRMEGERPGALWVLPVQQLIYRQLMYLVLIQSMISAVTGARVRWQRMHRVGVLGQMLPAPPPPGQPAWTPGSPRPTRRPLVVPAPAGPPRKSGAGKRERWLDTLRAAALIRVIIYHGTTASWLSLVFPSMGVMFALGGSLMVASLRHTPAIDVIGHRLRRLLPPLWLMGAVLVPLMLWQGWANDTGDTALSWPDLVFWVFPVLDPPGSAAATDATVVLWYIRAYMWFVLLTPLMLAAYRRWPMRAMLAPLVVVAVDQVLGWGLESADNFGPVLIDFCTFATCWMLGFAHREGKLRAIKPIVLLALTTVAFAVGGGWTYLHPSPDTGYDLGEIPLGQALISAGAVLILLRFNPTLGWFDRIPGLSRLLAVINARAITIYLTHNIAITMADPIDTEIRVNSTSGYVGTVAALVVLAVLAFGWVEDVAARRPVKLIPGGKRVPATVPAPVERHELVDPTPRTAPIPLQMPVPVPAPRRTPGPVGRPLPIPRRDPRQTDPMGTRQGRRIPPGDGAPAAGGWR